MCTSEPLPLPGHHGSRWSVTLMPPPETAGFSITPKNGRAPLAAEPTVIGVIPSPVAIDATLAELHQVRPPIDTTSSPPVARPAARCRKTPGSKLPGGVAVDTTCPPPSTTE